MTRTAVGEREPHRDVGEDGDGGAAAAAVGVGDRRHPAGEAVRFCDCYNNNNNNNNNNNATFIDATQLERPFVLLVFVLLSFSFSLS